MNAGIVILSRFDSSRVPGKPLQLVNGVPLIQLLIDRCLKTGLRVCLGIPAKDVEKFQFLNSIFKKNTFSMFCGHDEDPLRRMHNAMFLNGWDYAVRVCHDKIFIDPELVLKVLNETSFNGADYGILKDPIDGTAFEVIKNTIIKEASEKHQNVEHISYAVKTITNKIYVHESKDLIKTEHRFLVDYPKDLTVLNMVLKSCGNDCSLQDAITFLDQHYWISRINRLPRATIYTCAYNAEKWISKCMGSVSMQQNFNNYEYIIVDDKSTDATAQIANKFCRVYKNTFLFTNSKNLGLASSSNVALSAAKGRYLIRIDADDFFLYDRVIEDMITYIEKSSFDVIYPSNYFGGFKRIQAGDECHHIGGALFKTAAANHVKFTEKLRGYEGLDFFARARGLLNVGYFKRPTFYYRQHEGSLSKTNPEERAKILEDINNKYASNK